MCYVPYAHNWAEQRLRSVGSTGQLSNSSQNHHHSHPTYIQFRQAIFACYDTVLFTKQKALCSPSLIRILSSKCQMQKRDVKSIQGCIHLFWSGMAEGREGGSELEHSCAIWAVSGCWSACWSSIMSTIFKIFVKLADLENGSWMIIFPLATVNYASYWQNRRFSQDQNIIISRIAFSLFGYSLTQGR